MNNNAKQFWDNYWSNLGKEQPTEVDAFQFGADADWLASLVVVGKKTATCSGYVFYELEKEPLPQKGNYSIVLNSKDVPVAIIELTDVFISPMNEVPLEFALAEGEGDYEYWWNAHEQFFGKALQSYNLTFEEDMLLVCERFKVIHTAE